MSILPELENRRWKWILRICVVFTILPLYAARHLPMTDLPEHLAVIATLRHYWDPAWHSQEYFQLGGVFETQYWLYHITGAIFAFVFGSAERANLILLSLIGVAYPYALRELLRAIGSDERLALFGAPLFWSRSFIVGLLNFVASVPVLVFGLALVVRQSERATLRRGIGLALLATALFYLHICSFLLFGMQAVLATWLLDRSSTRGRGLRAFAAKMANVARRLVWLAPATLVSVIVVLHGSVGADSTRGIHFRPRLQLLQELPHWMFDNFRNPIDDVLGWLLLATGILMTAVAVFRAGAITTIDGDAAGPSRIATLAKVWLRENRLALALFAATLLAYFSLPDSVGGYAGLIDVRMAVFVGMFFPLLLRPASGRHGGIPLAFAAVICLGFAFHTTYQIHAFEEEEVGRFDDLLRRMPHGARLLTLNFEPNSKRVVFSPFKYFGSYYRARYGGIASFSFSELHHWPLRYRPEWSPPRAMTWGNPCLYRNGRDGPFFDYILTHGELDPFRANPPGPKWSVIGSSRSWKLYARAAGTEPQAPNAVDSDVGPCAAPST